jgi:hypothetical protein
MYLRQWTFFDDIIVFVTTLQEPLKISFLIVLRALCWAFWKNQNSIIFNQSGISLMRSIICLILSSLNHWSRSMRISETRIMHLRLPHNLDLIPLQMLDSVPQVTNVLLVT